MEAVHGTVGWLSGGGVMWKALRRWGERRRWLHVALWAVIGAYLCLMPPSLAAIIMLAPFILVVLVVA